MSQKERKETKSRKIHYSTFFRWRFPNGRVTGSKFILKGRGGPDENGETRRKKTTKGAKRFLPEGERDNCVGRKSPKNEKIGQPCRKEKQRQNLGKKSRGNPTEDRGQKYKRENLGIG